MQHWTYRWDGVKMFKQHFETEGRLISLTRITERHLKRVADMGLLRSERMSELPNLSELYTVIIIVWPSDRVL